MIFSEVEERIRRLGVPVDTGSRPQFREEGNQVTWTATIDGKTLLQYCIGR